METVIFLIALVPWTVAMWAMVMMIISALKRERFTFDRYFGGGIATADYNRHYLWIFVGCILADIIVVATVSGLFLVGWLKL